MQIKTPKSPSKSDTTYLLFLRQAEAADLLRLSGRTLERWRLEGVGPPYRRFGRRVLYDKHDLLIWAEAQTRTSTSA